MVKKENLSDGEMGGWGGGGKEMLDDSSFVCLTLVALNREQLIFSTEHELALGTRGHGDMEKFFNLKLFLNLKLKTQHLPDPDIKTF